MKTTLVRILLLTILVSLILPIIISLSIAFSPDSFLTIPTNNWTSKWFYDFFYQTRWTEAFLRSLIMAILSTFLSLTFGMPLAYAMTRLNIPWKKLIHGSILLPLIIPPIIIGMGALPLFYAMRLNGTTFEVVLIHSCLILPIIYLILKNKIQNISPEIENVAMGLGAGIFETLWYITLPLLYPAIAISGICGFAISINETMVALFMAGPTNETISTITWSQLKEAPTPLIAVASIINLIIILIGTIAIKFASITFSYNNNRTNRI
ncbi:MAG: ABC transporter permease subunit [Planctomycetota bacterium]